MPIRPLANLLRSYLASVCGAVSKPLSVENVLWRSAVDRVALEVGAKPAGRVVVEEALGLLYPGQGGFNIDLQTFS